jgi:hypothetical protein
VVIVEMVLAQHPDPWFPPRLLCQDLSRGDGQDWKQNQAESHA